MTMNNRASNAPSIRSAAQIENEAAEWLACRDAGRDLATEAAFQQWLAADVRHGAAIAEIEAAWGVINRPRQSGTAPLMLGALQHRAKRRRRHRIMWGSTTLGLAAAMVTLFFVSPEWLSLPGHAPTVTLKERPDLRPLADGSVVELYAGAVINVELTPSQRRVTLLRGVAHFSVAKDAVRPFVVVAGDVAVRAVGTQFAVDFATQKVEVLVNEGQVAVARALPETPVAETMMTAPAPKPVLVDAGSRVVVRLDESKSALLQPQPVSPMELNRALAWRGKRVEFTGTPLAEAVAMFNRQNAVKLALQERELGALRVSGIFWADDPEGFARLVESSFGLRSQWAGADRIVLGR